MIMFNTSSAVAVASLRAFVTCLSSTLSAPRRVVTCFGLSILGTKPQAQNNGSVCNFNVVNHGKLKNKPSPKPFLVVKFIPVGSCRFTSVEFLVLAASRAIFFFFTPGQWC